MITQIGYIIGHTTVSEIQIIGLCRIFGSQCVNLLHYRQDAYTLPIITHIKDTIFHIPLKTDTTSYLEVREPLYLRLAK